MRWIPVHVQLPPENELVDTKIDDQNGVRNEQQLRRVGKLYFTENIYVYYTPTHWKRIEK